MILNKLYIGHESICSIVYVFLLVLKTVMASKLSPILLNNNTTRDWQVYTYFYKLNSLWPTA